MSWERVCVSADLQVVLEGVGDVEDEDGTRAGRGILVSVGAASGGSERRHKLYVSVSEEAIARLAPHVGQEIFGRLLLGVGRGLTVP